MEQIQAPVGDEAKGRMSPAAGLPAGLRHSVHTYPYREASLRHRGLGLVRVSRRKSIRIGTCPVPLSLKPVRRAHPFHAGASRLHLAGSPRPQLRRGPTQNPEGPDESGPLRPPMNDEVTNPQGLRPQAGDSSGARRRSSAPGISVRCARSRSPTEAGRSPPRCRPRTASD